MTKPESVVSLWRSPARILRKLPGRLAIFSLLICFLGGARVFAASCFSLPSGAIAWWPGDGNATSIISTNNGTLVGGATASGPGFINTAFTFDGTNSYVQIPDSTALRPTNLTIEAWVRFDSLDSAGSGGSPAGDQYIVFRQNSRTGDFEGFDLQKVRLVGKDVFALLVSSAAGQAIQLESVTALSIGVWYHVAAVRGTNFLQIYVNGQLERQTNITFAQDYGNNPLYFGTSGQTFWDHKFRGALDEVALFNRALSSNEIASIYAAGNAGICKGPGVVTAPVAQSVAIGGNAIFSVVASGLPTLGYQWQFSGTNIAGATNTALNLINVQSAQGGNYAVLITNSFGTVTSPAALLTVLTPPSISTQPQSRTNVAGTVANFSIAAGGTAPLGYQWQLNGANLSGSTASILTLNNVQSIDAGLYSVIVSNIVGTITSSSAQLTVWTVPGFTLQPQSRTNVQGTSATFTTTASGNPAPTYQWQLNGAAIANATTSALTLNNAQPSDAGNYACVALNSAGSVTSAPAALTIWVVPAFSLQPQNRTNVSGTTATFTATASGNPAPVYQWQLNGASIANATTTVLALNNVQPSDAGNYACVALNSAGSVTSAPAALTIWVAPSISLQPQSRTNVLGTSASFTGAASGTPAPTYQWRVNGLPIANATTTALTLNNVQTSDAGSYTLAASNSAGLATSSQAVLTVWFAPGIALQPQSRTNAIGSNATFTVTATGNPSPAYQWQYNGSPIANATSSALTLNNIQITDAGSYSCLVSNVVGFVTSSSAALTVLAAPEITLQPVNRTDVPGTPANFSVTATGTQPLNYQWLLNGVNIPGATNSTYNSSIQPGTVGTYAVAITNVVGTAVSVGANLSALISFPDANLDTAVRTTVNKLIGMLTSQDLALLTNLVAPNKNIVNLTGLEWAYMLTDLYLSGNAIGNLTPLQGSKSLTHLYVDHNPINNLTALSGVSSLKVLNAGFDNLTTAAPLSGLTNLTGLWLYNNPITSLSFLGTLNNLTSLGIEAISVADLSPVAGLTSLNYLSAGGGPIIGYTSFSGLTNLNTLWLPQGGVSNISFVTNLRGLTSLNLEFNGISDFAPLSGLSNLTDLVLRGNVAPNISVVSGLTNLTSLSVESCAVATIDFLLPLKKLNYVYLGANSISNLSPLAGLVNLVGVNLVRNRVADLAAVQNLPQLSWVDLRLNTLNLSSAPVQNVISSLRNRNVTVYADPQNQAPVLAITSAWPIQRNVASILNFTSYDDVTPSTQLQLTAISSNPGLVPNPAISVTSTNGRRLSVTPALNQTGTANIQVTVTDEAGLQTVGNIQVTVLNPQTVSITDTNLDSQLRAALGGVGGPVTDYLLLSLTCVDACSSAITNLSGMQKATSLVCLSLCDNAINDISAIAGLTNLTSLNLGGNGITNLSMLQNLSRLTNLIIYNNPVTDLSPLSGLTNLANLEVRWLPASNHQAVVSTLTNISSLYLGGNSLSNITWLPNLSKLTVLGLDQNRVNDLSPLVGLPALKELDVSYNPLTNISQATLFPNLAGLYVSGDGVNSLTPFQSLTQLKTLMLQSNLISNIALASSMTNLDALGLGNNPIAGGIPQITNLSFLSLDQNKINDLSFLSGFTRLKAFGMANNQVTNISSISTLTNLISLFAPGNRLTDLAAVMNLSSLRYLDVRTNLLNLAANSATSNQIASLRNNGVAVLYQPQNQPPIISLIPSWAVASNTNSIPLPFYITDDVTIPDLLTVAGKSANQTLLPNSSLVFGGTNTDRTLVVTPAPGQTGSAQVAVIVTDDTGLSTTGAIQIVVINDQPVTIVDTNLQAAVRASIGKPTGTLTIIDMLGLTALDVSQAAVTTLSGLEYASNLTVLYLNATALPTLAGLSSLQKLAVLNIYNTPSSDLTPLSGLINLKNLYLQGYTISDLTPITPLIGLTNFTMNNTRVGTLAPLLNSTNLISLYLNYNWLTNIQALANLPRLAVVDVRLNKLNLNAGSPAMLTIQSLLGRGVTVYYTPQRTPPTISANSPLAIHANWTSYLLFTITDDGPDIELITAGVDSSNQGLIPNANVSVLLYSAPYYMLAMTPISGLSGTVTVTLRATNDAGLTTALPISVTVSSTTLAGGPLNNWTNFSWGSSPSAQWFVQTNVTRNGTPAARSGAITDSQETWLETTLTGPGRLTFWRKVSSEPNFDWLYLFLNGVGQPDPISGEVDWQQQTVNVPPGPQTVRWSYFKDTDTSVGTDAAWLSEVAYSPGSWLEITPPYNGQILLTLHGIPGDTYQIEYSTNLISWTTLTLVTPSSPSENIFDNLGIAGARFYRARDLSAVFAQPR